MELCAGVSLIGPPPDVPPPIFPERYPLFVLIISPDYMLWHKRLKWMGYASYKAGAMLRLRPFFTAVGES